MYPQTLFSAHTLEEAITKACGVYKHNIAVSQGSESITYKHLLQEIIAFKIWLNKTLGKETVLIKTDNNLNNLFLLFGAILSESIPLFYDPVWKRTELKKALDLNCCSHIITDDLTLINKDADEIKSEFKNFKLIKVTPFLNKKTTNLLPVTSFCRFTSGSTGFSRCLQFTQRAFLNAGYNWWLSAGYKTTDKIYCVAMLNNGLAFNTSLLATFFCGAELILHKGTILPSSIRKTFENKKPSIFIAFPFVYELMLKSDKIAPSIFNVRLAVSSAAPLTNEINNLFQKKFAMKICNYYGLAEVGPCTYNEGNINSVGHALKNVDIKIDLNNQVLIKTNSSASAFLDTEGEDFNNSFSEDHFFITKDVGMITNDGQLILKGRIGRMINIQGRKIDPVEIEKLLLTEPAIKHIVIQTNMQNEHPILTAYIESTSVKKEHILKLCAENLAPYKIPQQVIIMDRLPRSSTGKISIGNIETNAI